MSRIRGLAGTRKGAFILTSDGSRQRWSVDGPHFAGWEIYHLKGSPADPDRLYASQSSAWFGQIIQRSSDGGKTWEVPGGEKMPSPTDPPGGIANKFVYDTEPSSRATVAVRSHWPAHVWRYFKAVQQAFYAQGRDVTQREVLAAIAEECGLPRAEFEAAFDGEPMRLATRNDFSQAQHWGIRGFPALLAEVGGELHLVSHGYVPEGDLRERLAALPNEPH